MSILNITSINQWLTHWRLIRHRIVHRLGLIHRHIEGLPIRCHLLLPVLLLSVGRICCDYRKLS